MSPFINTKNKRKYKEPICKRCGKSRSKDKNEHPSKRFCSDDILSTKITISYPHICTENPCNMNCGKLNKL